MTDLNSLTREQLIEQLMESQKKIEELTKSLDDKEKKNQDLEKKLEEVQDEWALLRSHRFGPHSEKMDSLLSFVVNEAETIVDISEPVNEEEENSAVLESIDRAQRRQKHARKTGKKKNYKGVKVVETEVHYEFEKDFFEKHPDAKLTKEYKFVELVMHEAWMERKTHIIEQAILKDKTTDDGKDVVVKANEDLHPFWDKALLSSSLLAHIAWNKYGMAMPIYRQSKNFSNLGMSLSPQIISTWLTKSWEEYGHFLLDEMKEDLKKARVVHGDETNFPVLETRRNKNRTSCYVVQAATGNVEDKKMVLFCYTGSRSGEFVPEIFGEGTPDRIMHSDGYKPYFTKGFTNVICMDHVRRGFKNGLECLDDFKEWKKMNNDDSITEEQLKQFRQNHSVLNQVLTIMELFARLYRNEKEFKEQGLNPQQISEKRKELDTPIVKELTDRVTTLLPKTQPDGTIVKMPGISKKLEEAAGYFMNFSQYFDNFLEHGEASISNILAENGMRSVALVRKNSLFFKTENGAECGMGYLSLIQSAQRNNLNPQKYLAYVFEELKNHREKVDKELYRTLLPYSKTLPEELKLDVKTEEAESPEEAA